MQFLQTFLTRFGAKDKTVLAEKLKIRQEIKQLTAELDTKFVTLKSLESNLQHEKTTMLLIEIQNIRYEIQKIKFEIIQIKEQIGVLTEREDSMKEQEL